jgi:putative transposase
LPFGAATTPVAEIAMARMARVVLPNYPNHITQRGNWRQNIFREEEDYLLYLELLQKYSQRYELEIPGYCLMTDHVPIVGEPYRKDALANTFKYCHGEYAKQFNKNRKSGHLWKSRPYSCVLDESQTDTKPDFQSI